MKIFKDKSNIIGLIMFIMLIVSAIMIRTNNHLYQIISIGLFIIFIVLGLILLKIDKK